MAIQTLETTSREGDQHSFFFDDNPVIEDNLHKYHIYQNREEAESKKGAFFQFYIEPLSNGEYRLDTITNQGNKQFPSMDIEWLVEHVMGLHSELRNREDRVPMDIANRIFEPIVLISDIVRIFDKEFPVVHGISHSGGAGSADVDENIPIWDRFNHVFKHKNDLRCSTIDKNDYGLWYPLGVVLENGEIIQAYEDDGGTSYVDGKAVINNIQQISIEEQLTNAINNRRPNRYNEIVVVNPTLKGIYFCPSDIRLKEIQKNYEKILFEKTNHMQLPYFLLTESGELIEMIYDIETNSFRGN